MPDTLTPEERAAIDRFPAGQINRVPTGASAFEMRWDESKKAVRYVDPAKRSPNGHGKPRRGPAPDPGVARRRQRVAAMHADGATVAKIAEALGRSDQQTRDDLAALGLKANAAKVVRPPQPTPEPVLARRAEVRELVGAGLPRAEIARALGVAPKTIATDIEALGLEVPRKRPGPNASPVADAVRRHASAERTVREVFDLVTADGVTTTEATVRATLSRLGLSANRARRKRVLTPGSEVAPRKAAPAGNAPPRDRRRFKDTKPPSGEARVLADAEATGAIFPGRVAAPAEGRPVLVGGANNRKIGGDVLVGRLRGAKILTLTLEERATCPRACQHWRSCYGNNMQWPTRWRHGPELIDKIAAEIAEHCAGGRCVLVRLHVLGDFWSVDYVQSWEALLDEYPGLHVFGFTAWAPDTPIGGEIAAVRQFNPGRFMIRHSGSCYAWGAFTLDHATRRKRIGEAIVCPEQRDAGTARATHCGNCGVCWATDRPIAFMEH